MEGLAVSTIDQGDAALTTFWSDKRVLVTGATGMVGSWLVHRLVAAGAHTVVLIRDADPQSELIRTGLITSTTVVNGRLEDYATLERAISEHEVDSVFHLGAQTIVGAAYRSPLATLEANVRGTWNVLEASRVHSSLVQRVVVASSDKAYGEQEDLPYREDMPLEGRQPYEVSKSCTDLVTASYARTYGLPTTIARCGNIYGGGDLNWSRLVPGTIRSLLRQEQPVLRSDGTFVRDYLHVDDVVDAYLQLGAALPDERVTGEAYNFSDEAPRTVMEIYQAVCQAMKADVEPLILGRAAGELKDQYLSAAKARDTLGWTARVPLEEGLARTVAWYADLLGTPSPGG